MELYREMQGHNNYLVCKISTHEDVDTAVLGMLTNNNITGLAPVVYSQHDNERVLKFNITGKTPAIQVFAQIVSKKIVLSFFSSVFSAIDAVEDYAIDVSNLLFDMEHIYIDTISGLAELICVPINNRSPVDITAFLKEILFHTQFSPSEDNGYVGILLNAFNNNKSISDIKELTAKLLREISPGNRQSASLAPRVPVNVGPTGPARPGPVQPVVAIYNAPQPPVAPVRDAPQSPVSLPNILHHDPMSIPPPLNGSPEVKKYAAAFPHSDIRDEPPISLLYLLQHYNSANAAKYRAQKAAKKQEKDKRKNSKSELPAPGFAVPGHDVAPASGKLPHDILPLIDSAHPQHESARGVNPGYDFGDTIYQNEQPNGGGTVFMNPESGQQYFTAFIIRKRNNERIAINKNVFRLGRISAQVDYAMPENEHISSSHCHIITRAGEYFIVDNNSKNHTHVNGLIIPCNTEIKLMHGQDIVLANEGFEFRLH